MRPKALLPEYKFAADMVVRWGRGDLESRPEERREVEGLIRDLGFEDETWEKLSLEEREFWSGHVLTELQRDFGLKVALHENPTGRQLLLGLEAHIRSLLGCDLNSYDTIIVAFSGGKDSLACLLHLFDLGVPPDRIELWHHDVDGREGSSLMDWPCTRDYCRAVAEAFGLPLYYSWKVGGFEGEMLRHDVPTAETAFETPEGVLVSGGSGPPGTRLKFPQVSADLTVRWCSAYLKIDVCATAIRGQKRFVGQRTLVLTGERAQESNARAGYKLFEPHRSDLRNGRPKNRRLVDQWRPVHSWREWMVWEIIQRYGINPHPAYRLGWGRVSCAACIFGSPNQWASLADVNPDQFDRIAQHERQLGKTIQRKLSVTQLAQRGVPYDAMRSADRQAALSSVFTEPILLGDAWRLPAGAFGESTGPT